MPISGLPQPLAPPSPLAVWVCLSRSFRLSGVIQRLWSLCLTRKCVWGEWEGVGQECVWREKGGNCNPGRAGPAGPAASPSSPGHLRGTVVLYCGWEGRSIPGLPPRPLGSSFVS